MTKHRTSLHGGNTVGRGREGPGGVDAARTRASLCGYQDMTLSQLRWPWLCTSV